MEAAVVEKSMPFDMVVFESLHQGVTRRTGNAGEASGRVGGRARLRWKGKELVKFGRL